MARSKRHAVLVIARPTNWQPRTCTDLPTPLIYAQQLTLGQAAEVARQFNLAQFERSTGRWALACKGLARNSTQPRIAVARASVVHFFRGDRYDSTHPQAMGREQAIGFARGHNLSRTKLRAVVVDALVYATIPAAWNGGAA